MIKDIRTKLKKGHPSYIMNHHISLSPNKSHFKVRKSGEKNVTTHSTMIEPNSEISCIGVENISTTNLQSISNITLAKPKLAI